MRWSFAAVPTSISIVIDCALRAVAKNWDLMRMPGADRNLLRIAVYEMRFLTDEEVWTPS